ncbi:hypothetical protein PTKIN_Ptkin17bG0049700 [Pterospermum kingtungense]
MSTLRILISLFLPTLFLLSCSIPVVPSFSPSDEATISHSRDLDDQRSALVQLQQSLYFSPNFTFSSKAQLWDLKTYHCSWKGVTCDAIGHVIGLDLNYRNLSGSFHSIFNLHHLQRLSLAGNNFNTTLFSYGFERLPNLTHLNLSDSCFHGQVPIGISNSSRLVSLDLSYQQDCYLRNGDDDYYSTPTLKLEKPNFKTLIKNLRSLRELHLDGVDISTQSGKWCETVSLALSNIHVLSMSDCGLTGPLCSSMFSKLHFLSQLNLNGNPIYYLPPNFLKISSPLVSLHLSSCDLIGHFPTEVFLLPKMQNIDISDNGNLMGQLPEFPINNSLQVLTLSYTNFQGKLPKSIGNLKLLTELDLGGCSFSGSVPSSVANLTHLAHLNLRGNQLSGSIYSSLFALPKLESLDISYNNFGSMKLDMLIQLKNLRRLDLSNLSLVIGSDHRNLTFPQLEELSLNYCNLTEFPEFIKNQHKLTILYLSNNQIHGVVPNWLWKTTLSWFDLSSNDIYFSKQFPSGDANSSFSNESHNSSFIFPQLEFLRLRSCNLTEFPEFIKTQDKLVTLDLSQNQIHGVVPNWLWKTTLSRLDLSSNAIYFPKQFPSGNANSSFSNESHNSSFIFPQLLFLSLRSCNLTEFPEFIKTQDKLVILDISSNAIDFPKQFPFDDANSSFPILLGLSLASCNLTKFPEFLKSLENCNDRLCQWIGHWVLYWIYSAE